MSDQVLTKRTVVVGDNLKQTLDTLSGFVKETPENVIEINIKLEQTFNNGYRAEITSIYNNESINT